MHPFRARSGSVRASGVRLHPVVAVQEQDPVARRPVDADVARRAQAAVLLVDDGQPSVPACLLVAQLARAVRRAVVDHDDLKVAVGLRDDAVQRLPEVGQHVVDGHYHVYERALGERVRVWLWLLHVRVASPGLHVVPAG